MIPNSVILYISPVVLNLKQYICDIPYLKERNFIHDIIEDIVRALSHPGYSKVKLHDLIVEISSGAYQYGSVLLNPRLAAPIMMLALAIHQELRDKCLYLPDGRLPFQYLPVTNIQFNDLLMVKTNVIPYTAPFG